MIFLLKKHFIIERNNYMVYDYKKYNLKSVKRICNILESFIIKKEELSLSDICKITGLNKSVVFRNLVNLEEEGYIIKNKENGKYFIGIKIFQLGNIVKEEMILLNKSSPIMEFLSEQLKENVYLFKLFQNKRICISKIEAPQDLTIIVNVGDSFPLYCEASGKAILSFLDDKTIEFLISKDNLLPVGPRTIIDPNKLKSELVQIKKKGYAMSYEERIPHSFSIAAPIFDYQLGVIGSISVSGPYARFYKDKIKRTIYSVKEASDKISYLLGYKT